MAAPLPEILLDRLAFAAGNLAARSRRGAARAEVLACLKLYRTLRQAEKARAAAELAEATLRDELVRLAAEADRARAAEPGHRKDIDG